MKNFLLIPVAACIAFGFAPSANAQLVDDIELRQEGANAVAQIKFVTPVQYSRSISSRALDLVQAFYTVLPTRDQISVQTSERRLVGVGAIPTMIVTDEAVDSPTQVSVSRKLVVRFTKPVRFRVRAGRGNQSIEIVFEGLGGSVKETVAQMAKPVIPVVPVQGRFVVTLQSSSQAGATLSASVPASLQNYQVFTARRVSEGQTFYDINLGYFTSRQEAQNALDIVNKRFPAATIAGVQSTLNPVAAVEKSEAAPMPVPGTTATQTSPAAEDVETQAAALLVGAQSAFDGGNYTVALESLNPLLNLPPNTSSRRALELAGLSRLNSGDTVKAKGEFDLFLQLYPTGPDSDRIRQLVVAMPSVAPAATAARQPAAPVSTTSGSVSMFYYGGKSDVRTQEFKDSVLGGLPVLQSDTTLSAVDQKQIQTNLDLNWRYRDTEKDMRFVFRDAYSADLLPRGVSKERLSALYFDYRSLTNGTSLRVGRQSPNGGGVLYRFDGLTAGYIFQPKWKLNAVMGTPTDPLLDTRRTFYGMSVDAEALTKEIGASAYVVEQVIDGQTDRRAIGADVRYFKGGISASGQLDYDVVLNAINIAALQGTWQVSEGTVLTAMFDRRSTPVMSLGNVLFFQDPALLVPARRVEELLGTSSIGTLREQVKALTAYQTQARIGGTTSIAEKWQVGADASVTNVDEIKPVAVLLPNGQPSTGNLWSLGVQLIGSNLYSARDTHVFNMNVLGGPTYRGTLLTYNNLSSLSEKWQLEPSFKYYTQRDTAGGSNDVATLGVRAVYRVRQQISLESELTYERSETTSASASGPGNQSSTARMTYYVGGRYDF